jgi:hypothetical protein
MKAFWPTIAAVFIALLLLGEWKVTPGPVVDPKPTPNDVTPGPTPTPVDRVEKAWVIIVREYDNQPPEQAAMLNEVRKAVGAMGYEWCLYDDGMKVVQDQGFVAMAKDGLPALFVRSEDGSKTLLNIKLPGTAEDVLAEIRKATGQ